MLKNSNLDIPIHQPKGKTLTSFSSCFTRNLILPAYLLDMESSLKFHFDKQIARNSVRKNAYSSLRRLDVECIKNDTLAVSLTSLTSK